MSPSSSSRRSVRRPNAGHNYAANAPGTQSPLPATQFVSPSTLISQIPVVDAIDWVPPTPRIRLRELPAVPLTPQPLFRLHSTLGAPRFRWDVRLDPQHTELTPLALLLPAFESPRDLRSLRLHFSPLADAPAMDYSCDVAVPADTPLTVGHVFRAIHDAVHAAVEPTALPRGDPLRQLAEQAFCRCTGRRFIPHVDVLRKVDLHIAGWQSHRAAAPALRGGLYFHGIVVEWGQGAYPVFRVVLRDHPPFA